MPSTRVPSSSTGPTGAVSERAPQPVACVDLTDEKLGLLPDTSPPETMVMSVKLVELLQREDDNPDKVAQLRAYFNGLSKEEEAYLVAMLGTANEEGDILTEEAPQTRRPRMEATDPPSQNTWSRTAAVAPQEQSATASQRPTLSRQSVTTQEHYSASLTSKYEISYR